MAEWLAVLKCHLDQCKYRPQSLGLSCTKHRGYFWSLLSMISIYPSLCGWNAVDRRNFVPLRQNNSRQKRPTKIGSRSDTRISPFYVACISFDWTPQQLWQKWNWWAAYQSVKPLRVDRPPLISLCDFEKKGAHPLDHFISASKSFCNEDSIVTFLITELSHS